MANDFASDPFCQAVYRFESASLSSDSRRSNHLSTGSLLPPVVDTTAHREGDGSVLCSKTYKPWYYRNDADLSIDFPFKSTEEQRDFTITCWLKLTTGSGNGRFAYSKRGSFCLMPFGSPYSGIYFFMQYAGGPWISIVGPTSTPFALNKWYFVAWSYNNATRTHYMHCWDYENGIEYAPDNQQTVPNIDGEASVSTYPFTVGMGWWGGISSYLDGNLDELVVWNRVLTRAEYDQVRQGIFKYVVPAAPPILNLGCKGISTTLQYKVMPIHPMWPAKEVLSWKTDIIRPKSSGKEQRIALRTKARQNFQFTYLMDDVHDRSVTEGLLHSTLKDKWGIPIWMEAEIHTDDLPSGSSTINVDTRYADFRDDSYAIIWQTEELYEVVKITSHTDSQLTLNAATGQSFTGSKMIMPLRFGYVTNPASMRFREDGSATLDVDIGIVDNETVSGHTAAMTYDSLEVLLTASLVDRDNSVFDPDHILYDNGVGVIGADTGSEFNEITQSLKFLKRTKAQRWGFRQFLHSLVGMQKTVLIPTWEDDMVLSQSLSANGTVVYIQSIDLEKNMDVNAMRTYIAFPLASGSIAVRKILNISEVSSDEESITINTKVGETIAEGTAIMFVDQCRLGTDDVEIEWEEGNNLRSSVSFVRVEE